MELRGIRRAGGVVSQSRLVAAGEGGTNVESVFLWFVGLEYVDACEDDFVLETVLVLENVM